LGEDELKATKENLGWPLEPRFYVPEEVGAFFRQAVGRGQALEAAYTDLLEAYSEQYPAEAAEYRRVLAGELPRAGKPRCRSFQRARPRRRALPAVS